MMGQMPVAFAFGQMMRGAAKPLMDQAFSQPPKAFASGGQGAASPAATPAPPFGGVPGMLRPKGAATMQQASAGAAAGGNFCPKCGKALAVDASFCSGCGNKVSTPFICKNCGRELAPDDRFCPKCGTKKED
jgi:RNA polymerase subunit RPABC4/transcription elongation factor Spt4